MEVKTGYFFFELYLIDHPYSTWLSMQGLIAAPRIDVASFIYFSGSIEKPFIAIF